MPEPVTPTPKELSHIYGAAYEEARRGGKTLDVCEQLGWIAVHTYIATMMREALAERGAAERARKSDVSLKYCKRCRTIVPAFKDHRLSCCVLADVKAAAYRTGQMDMFEEVRRHGVVKEVLDVLMAGIPLPIKSLPEDASCPPK